MNLSLRLSLLATASLLAPAMNAAVVFTASETLSSDNIIFETPLAGLARQLTVTTPGTQITDLSITLDISSPGPLAAWNGDLYAHISGPSGTLAVLINRPGLSLSDSVGYGDAGFSITLNDNAGNPDIHTYQDVAYSLNGNGQLLGTWASDGRQSATDSTRDRPLSQFLGQDPNGVWTLLISDLSGGNIAVLDGWSVSGVAVPEPGAWTVVAGTALVGFAFLYRRFRSV